MSPDQTLQQPVDQTSNTPTPQPAQVDAAAPIADTNTLPTVASSEKQRLEEKNEPTKEQKKVDEVQQRIRSNRILFYGLPLVVIVYAIGVILFLLVPAVQKYFSVKSDNEILDQNITSMQQSANNLKAAVNSTATYEQYETELSTYIPTDARIGQLISLIQTQANDFGLEKQEITAPDTKASPDRSSINNLAPTDAENNALFESITSGELEFTPIGITTDAKAKLLEIDVDVKGKRDNFLKFVDSMNGVKPLINLVFIEYQERPNTNGDADITASLRFESYALKLNPGTVKAPKRYSVDDTALLTVIPVETFNVSSEVRKSITLTTPTPTP